MVYISVLSFNLQSGGYFYVNTYKQIISFYNLAYYFSMRLKYHLLSRFLMKMYIVSLLYKRGFNERSYTALLAYLSECTQSVKCQLPADCLLFKRHSIIFAGSDSTSPRLRFRKQCECTAVHCVLGHLQWNSEREESEKTTDGRRYLPTTYLIRDSDPEHTQTLPSQQQRQNPPSCKMDKRTEGWFLQWKIDERPVNTWKGSSPSATGERQTKAHGANTWCPLRRSSPNTWQWASVSRGEAGASVRAAGGGE